MASFSIIIPTYQRRELTSRTVVALDHQQYLDFEVLVVVDGSTDGTVGALRSLAPGFPLRIIEQPNRGRGEACNVGAAAATGELLLFLDDDMQADPNLLAEHARSHRNGADLVLGDVPLDPDSPRTLLSWGVGLWAHERRRRLAEPGAEIRPDDLLMGQASIRRDTFERLGGFDAGFTRDGLFGGEDIDLGWRAVEAGLNVEFNPDAISRQLYDVDPDDYLRRSFEVGRSAEELMVKHPEAAEGLARGPAFETRRSRWLLGPLVRSPRAVSWPIRAPVVALARAGRRGARLRRVFFALRTLEHLRGARVARRKLGTGSAVVLAYHAIADLRGDETLEPYGVPPKEFARQLDSLAGQGWSFIDFETLLDALSGRRRLPPKAMLLTFDDAYADFFVEALPMLAEREIPAVLFAVAGRVGDSNEWDKRLGTVELQLMDAEQLRAAASQGIEVGSHTMSHPVLPRLDPAEAEAELLNSAEALEALRLPRPRAFAYPYGAWTPSLARTANTVGYAAAFITEHGFAGPEADRYALPRIEVLRSDTPTALRLKIASAGSAGRLRTGLLRLLKTR